MSVCEGRKREGERAGRKDIRVRDKERGKERERERETETKRERETERKQYKQEMATNIYTCRYVHT